MPLTALLNPVPSGTLCGWFEAGSPKEGGSTGTTTGGVLEGLREPPIMLSMEKGERCAGELALCTGATARPGLSWG